MVLESTFWHQISSVSCIAYIVFLLIFAETSENFSYVNMAKKKGNNMNSESKKYRITCERSLNYDNIAEITVYEYL